MSNRRTQNANEQDRPECADRSLHDASFWMVNPPVLLTSLGLAPETANSTTSPRAETPSAQLGSHPGRRDCLPICRRARSLGPSAWPSAGPPRTTSRLPFRCSAHPARSGQELQRSVATYLPEFRSSTPEE